MEQQILWIVATIGIGTLIGVFYKMKGEFGPVNLRAVGIVLIAVLVSILSISKSGDLNAALGILGTIAGYLFGTKSSENKNTSGNSGSSLDTSGSEFGDNAKLAGRDINETVNNIQSQIKNLSSLIDKEGLKIDSIIASQKRADDDSREYLINTIFERGADKTYSAVELVTNHWASQGWSLIGMVNLYDQTDALVMLFSRASEEENAGNIQRYLGTKFQRDNA